MNGFRSIATPNPNSLDQIHLATRAYHATIQRMLWGESNTWSTADIGVKSLGADNNPIWKQAFKQFLEDTQISAQREAHRELLVQLQQDGRNGEALAALRQLTSIAPGDAEHQERLGALLADCGERNNAEVHLRQALMIDPRHTAARLKLIELLVRDRREEARQQLQAIHEEAGPTLAKCLLQLELAIADGESGAATEIQQHLIEVALVRPGLMEHVLSALIRSGATDKAMDLWRQARSGKEALACDLAYAACLVSHQATHQAATGLWQEWRKLYASSPEMMRILALRERQSNNPMRAESLLRLVTEMQPEAADAWCELGDLLLEQGNSEDALTITKTAWERNPMDPRINLDLGLLHVINNIALQGLPHLRCGLFLNPNAGHGYMALGAVLRLIGDLQGAEQACRTLLNSFPDNPAFRSNLGMCMLHQGDYAEGWSNYEARLAPELFPVAAPRGAMRWDQQTATKELILVAEQGAGDLIQFMRYAGFLKLLIPRVSICADPRFRSLLELFGLFDAIYTDDHEDPQIAASHWMPLMSVPGLLGVSADNALIEAPYLAASAQSEQRWRALLRETMNIDECLVGLHWQGNPEPERSWSMAGRSFRLEELAPLADCPDIRFISLQKGAGSEQLAACSFRDKFVNGQDVVDQCWDYAETAAILASCDLVITSDSGIAHLAGALGLTTWLLLHRAPDWRWGSHGDRTIWYPSVRLFRQTTLGDWPSVVAEVRTAMQTLPRRPDKIANG